MTPPQADGVLKIIIKITKYAKIGRTKKTFNKKLFMADCFFDEASLLFLFFQS